MFVGKETSCDLCGLSEKKNTKHSTHVQLAIATLYNSGKRCKTSRHQLGGMGLELPPLSVGEFVLLLIFRVTTDFKPTVSEMKMGGRW